MPDTPPLDLATALPCYRCGYDVRAQPGDGVCPECRTPVAESRRMAAIPKRPRWRESDPRWRRRMLAGAWALVLMPAMTFLLVHDWARRVRLPALIRIQGEQSLRDSFATMVYAYLVFCIGAVLLFSKERNRQAGRLDGTRRWGVVACYGVLLLGISQVGVITSLVTLGIAAMFMSIPPPYQPAITDWLVKIGTGYMYYGPHPSSISDVSMTVCAATVVLLACVPLFNALRSSGPRWLAVIVLAPLAVLAVRQIVYVVPLIFRPFGGQPMQVYLWSFYFSPDLLAGRFGSFSGVSIEGEEVVEVVKWCACLAIAVWLSVAQIAAMWRRKRSPAA